MRPQTPATAYRPLHIFALIAIGLWTIDCSAQGARIERDGTRGRGPAVTAIAIRPDGQGIIFGSQAGVSTTDANRPAEPLFASDLDHIHHLVNAPDASIIAVAGGSPAESGTIELWDWRERRRIRELEGHDDVVYSVAWTSDSRTLVSASADRTVRVWSVQTGKQIAKLIGHSGPVLTVAVSPDGRFICSGSLDQTIRVWDTSNWQAMQTLTNHLGPVNQLAYPPREESDSPQRPIILASAGGDNTVRLWQPQIGRLMRIARLPAAALAIDWQSPRSLYCGSSDGSLSLIDAETGTALSQERVSEGWITSVSVDRKRHRVWFGDSEGHIGSVETTQSGNSLNDSRR